MSILCFETGGTKLVAALLDESGDILARRIRLREPAQTARETLAVLSNLGRELCQQARVEAVSIGFGGTVNRDTNRPAFCYHEEGWAELDPVQFFRDSFAVPTFIENDCNLAALAECWFGFSHQCETLFYVTVGTGIGGGLVKRGRLLRLGPLGEAEVGHLVVRPEGPECPCGNRGCLETLCSGPGLSLLTRSLTAKTWDSYQLMQAFRNQDPEAKYVVEEAALLMGGALAHAVTLFSPDLLVLGGGVMQENLDYLRSIVAATQRHLFPPFRKGLRFELSRLRRDVVCRGAAVWALQALGKLEPPPEDLVPSC